MYILRPYPDELLGSFLHRATRQLGLSQKQLMTIWGAGTSTYFPMSMTSHAGFARACGMSFVNFLESHTLLPYLAAFMPKNERKQFVNSFLNTRSKPSGTSTASRYATQAAKLRFCPACNREDLLQYGDAYWRRSHQLPGVVLCSTHRHKLHLSDIRFSSTQSVTPPNEVEGYPIDGGLPVDVLQSITDISVAALNNGLPRRDWPTYYRRRAIKLGYRYKGTQIISDVLSTDLQTYFGKDYLEALGQASQPNHLRQWPAMLFRSSSRNTTAFKHVLLNVFLASSPSPSTSPMEVLRKPKGTSKNWPYIEIELVEKLNQEIERCRAAGERMTATELTTKIGAKQPLKSHRKKLPTLAALVDAFKASSESVRKTGGRPRIYKKRNRRPSNQAG